MSDHKKKTARILLLGLSVLLLLSVLRLEHAEGSFSSLQISDASLQSITDTRTEAESCLISGVRFNGEKLFYDREGNTFYYSLIEDDGRRFDPKITFESTGSGVKLRFLESSISDEKIRANHTWQMIAYDENRYWLASLKCTTLPLLNIRSEYELTQYKPTTFSMELFDNRREAGVRQFDSIGTIHIRGASTAVYPKAGYKIKLYSSIGKKNARNVSLLGMRSDSSWMLYAGYNDPERLRNVFSVGLWTKSSQYRNSFGIANGYELKYVELFLNGAYQGLYALGYMPDELQLGIDEAKQEVGYKNFQWFSYADAEHYEEAFTIMNEFPGFSVYDSFDRWKHLLDYCDVLNSGMPMEEMLEFVDYDNYIDFCLFLYIMQGVDHAYPGETKNIIATAKKTEDGYKMLFTPWDLDRTWGMGIYGPVLEVTDNHPFQFGPFGVYPPKEYPEVMDHLSPRYFELRSGEWSDASVIAMLEAYEKDIFASGAYARDVQCWPDSDHQSEPYGLSEFKDYVIERLHYCDAYFRP